jgi:hypothetical protein
VSLLELIATGELLLVIPKTPTSEAATQVAGGRQAPQRLVVMGSSKSSARDGWISRSPLSFKQVMPMT